MLEKSDHRDPGFAKSIEERPSLKKYIDYRKFLSDFYDFKKHQTKNDLRPYSYSTFAAAADIKSPHYLKMIIAGERNLSSTLVLKFAKALGLNKAETEEFQLLVNYNQTTDPAARSVLLRELSQLRVEKQIKEGELKAEAWEKVPSWVTWAIYAMLDQEGFVPRTEIIFDLLKGRATRDEISRSLEALRNSGYLIQGDFGAEKAPTHQESKEDVPPELVRQIQSQLTLLGLQSLEEDEPFEREFGSLTLALDDSEFEEVRFKLRQFRKQIYKDIQLKRATSKGKKVYQVNLQIFSLTKSRPAT